MRRQILNFFLLFLALANGAVGFLVMKGLYRDFSLLDFSIGMFVLPFFSGIFFLTTGIFIGSHAFKRMKSS